MICKRRVFLQRQLCRLAGVPVLLLFGAAQACEGCFDDWFAPYLQRHDGVTLSAGNAKEQNAISEYTDVDSTACCQTIYLNGYAETNGVSSQFVCLNGNAKTCKDRKADRRVVPGLKGQGTVAGFGGPLPPYVLDRGLPLNGQRAVGAMERYRDSTKYYGFSKVPPAGGASTTPPPPANGVVTSGAAQ